MVSLANYVSLYEYKTNTESDNIYFMQDFQCKIFFSTQVHFFFYYCFNYFITVLAFAKARTVIKRYTNYVRYLNRKQKNLVICQIFVEEFNKRTDDIKR